MEEERKVSQDNNLNKMEASLMYLFRLNLNLLCCVIFQKVLYLQLINKRRKLANLREQIMRSNEGLQDAGIGKSV